MGAKTMALSILFMVLTSLALPPVYACGYCSEPPPSRRQHPPITTRPPYVKRPPSINPPRTKPPVIIAPPLIPPPVVEPPPFTGGTPPFGGLTPPSIGGGGAPVTNPPSSPSGTCSIDILKLGLCVDVLGGLVHIGLGNPVQNVCCPVLQGLLELEAAVCLCTAIKLKVLNLNIYIPLALNVLITCGKNPPPGQLCSL